MDQKTRDELSKVKEAMEQFPINELQQTLDDTIGVLEDLLQMSFWIPWTRAFSN